MRNNVMLVVRTVFVCAFCVVLGTSTVATAQPQATLEILGREGDFYWVVETAGDGSRKGGWVSAQVPLDSIDRSALKSIPALGSVQASPPPAAASRLSVGSEQIAAPVAQPTRPQPNRQVPAVGLSPVRRGFWFNAGLGAGVAGCTTCVGRYTGPSGGMSLGGSIGDRVLLGVGTAGWSKNVVDEATAVATTLSGGILDARIRVYPALSSGFFLTGGLGLGVFSERAGRALGTGVVSLETTETGGGALFGLGWDIRVGKNVSLTPFYNGFAVRTASLDGYVDQFGLGITIH